VAIVPQVIITDVDTDDEGDVVVTYVVTGMDPADVEEAAATLETREVADAILEQMQDEVGTHRLRRVGCGGGYRQCRPYATRAMSLTRAWLPACHCSCQGYDDVVPGPVNAGDATVEIEEVPVIEAAQVSPIRPIQPLCRPFCSPYLLPYVMWPLRSVHRTAVPSVPRLLSQGASSPTKSACYHR
jgi:hypothetical protein